MSNLEPASKLKIHNPERLWGVTPSSLFFLLCDRVKDTSEYVEYHNNLEILRTNDERDDDIVNQVLNALSEELGLTTEEGELTSLGIIALTSDNPERIIQSLALREFSNLRQAVQDFARIEDTYMAREEFESFFPEDESIQQYLISSLSFAEVYSDSVEINQSVVNPFFEDLPELSVENRDWLLFAWSVKGLANISDEDVLWRLYTEVTDKEGGRISLNEVNPETILAHFSTTPIVAYSVEDLQVGLQQLKLEYEEERDRVKSLLTEFREPPKKIEDKLPLPDVERLSQDELKQLLDLLYVVNETESPVLLHPQFLQSRFNLDLYQLYQVFDNLEDVDLEVTITSENLIQVFSAPECDHDTGIREDYFDFLLSRYNALDGWIKRFSEFDTDVSLKPGTKKLDLLENLDKNLISPVYFTYTLLNPNRVGEEVMDRYVGNSDGLHLERVKLERWSEKKPDNAKPYQKMLDRLLNKGLQEELGQELVRIMTPYDDDTFREYASTLRDLVRQGYEIRLLTRYTRDKYLWDRLKENLIEPLGEHRTNVKIRTYSRYKEHEYISRGESPEYLEEFGIHGKLQTIGDTENGAVLLGSANFMENSFEWNPECGIYTENPIVLDSAITYFDFVWELAQADPVSFDQMREVPNREFYPNYYLR